MTRGAHADTSCPEVWARCLSPALLPPLPPRDIEPWWSWSSYRSCGVQRWHLAGCHLLERDRRSPRYLTPRVRSVRFQTSADSPPGNSAHSHLTQSCSFLYTTAAELTCPVSRPPAAFRPTAASEVLPVCTQSRTDRPPADAARQWKDLSL